VFHRFKYPKLILLIISIIAAYFVFSDPAIKNFVLIFGKSLGYPGAFFAGLFLPFGFTAAFGIGFFLNSSYSNILLAALIGACGALASDLLLFNFIKLSFKDELKRLERVHVIKEIEHLVEKEFSKKVRLYLLYIIAGILIASPLPNEVADMILGGFTKINVYLFSIMVFVLNVVAISVLLMI